MESKQDESYIREQPSYHTRMNQNSNRINQGLLSVTRFGDLENENEITNVDLLSCFRENDYLNMNDFKEIVFAENNSHSDEIALFVYNRYKNYFKSKNENVVYMKNYKHDNASGHHFVCYLDTRVLMEVSNEYMARILRNNKSLLSKVIKKKNSLILIISNKVVNKESLTDFLYNSINIFSNIKQTYNQFTVATESIIRKLVDRESRIIMLDLLNFIINVRDGYFTITKVLSTLLTMFTLTDRITNKLFNPNVQVQSGLTINELLLGFATFGVPEKILKPLKDFHVLTGKKVADCSFLMSIATKIISSLYSILEYMTETYADWPVIKEVKNAFGVLLSHFLINSKMEAVAKCYGTFVRNSQCVLDPMYREKALALYEDCNSDMTFKKFVLDSGSRFNNATWQAFYENVIKYVQTYGGVAQPEAVCVCLEGPARSGKSTFTKKLAEIFKKENRNVYKHYIPSIDAGKDYYDDYQNEEVFMMDDIGAESVSQWRHIVNMVSPIPLKLNCASVEKKNTKFLRAKLILLSTNHCSDMHSFTKADCIAEPEALFRRIHNVKVNTVVETKANGSQRRVTTLTYMKFNTDPNNKGWHSEFIDENSNINLPTSITSDNDHDLLVWLYSLIKTLEYNRDKVHCETSISDDSIASILGKSGVCVHSPDEFFDASSVLLQNNEPRRDAIRFSTTFNEFVNNNTDFVDNWRENTPELSYVPSWYNMVKEWVDYVSVEIMKILKFDFSSFNSLLSAMNNNAYIPVLKDLAGGIFVDILIYSFIYYTILFFAKPFLTRVKVSPDDPIAFLRETFDKFEKTNVVDVQSAGLKKDFPENITSLTRFSRVVRVHGREASIEGHVLVSGNKIVCPAHFNLNDTKVDIYQSWDHVTAKHIEREGIELKLIKDFLIHDLAVYEMVNCKVLYPKCRSLFIDNKNIETNNPNMYLIFGNKIARLFKGQTIFLHMETLIARQRGKPGEDIFHEAGTTFRHPLTAFGLCGGMLVDSAGSILGFHVAGNNTSGWAVVPKYLVAEDIKNVVNNNIRHINIKGEQLSVPYEDIPDSYYVDNKVLPGASVARLRYPKDAVKVSYPMAKTVFKETVFNAKINPIMSKLLEETNQIEDAKIPLVINKPIAMLEEAAKKSFLHQGDITADEEQYVIDLMELLIPEFTPISWEETIFGSDRLPPLNRDSSNGYGMAKNKDYYFDYVNRVIKPEGWDMINDFKYKCINGTLKFSDVLGVESLKDELRSVKKNNEPRTFRVMPLPHIVWAKKIFGELIVKFKQTMHETGICVGFNPYKDMHVLAEKLQKSYVRCDADFKKWDGTLNATIMRRISDVFLSKLRIVDDSRTEYIIILQNLMESTYNSTTLVYDAIYHTTHGMPSGTWLTLLLNCLYNKCITGLTLYNNGFKDVQHIFNVVDYVTGDDKICGASYAYRKAFNALTISATASRLGMTCTNGDKTPIVKESQPFEKLNYLKREFTYSRKLNRWMGKLSMNTILYTLQYYDSSKDYKETMQGKIRAMQVEAVLHGDNFYNVYLHMIKETYPECPLFTEDEIYNILSSDDGYREVCLMNNKDLSWTL